MTSLRTLVANTEVILFDFDGPLCDVFAGHPAWRVARALERLIGEHYSTDDPLEILRLSADASLDILAKVEDALIAEELSAVSVSRATEGGITAMRAHLDAGNRVGVISNNSHDAVVAFLESVGLRPRMSVIVGREPRKPWLMKPNPRPLRLALDTLKCAANSAVYVGDSNTDIEVAQKVGMPSVAYANKPGKRARFEALGATFVIDSMFELVAALSETS